MKILVTGGTGFVGSSLLECLALKEGVEILALVRSLPEKAVENVEYIQVDLSDPPVDTSYLEGVDAIIHCAARAHILNDESIEPLSAYRQVNVEGTRRLLTGAISQGVKRFVYLSSIKACGENSVIIDGLAPEDTPTPEDDYGISKLEAENEIKALCSDTSTDYVIIRPPLVYGPGVKGNFLNLLVWLYENRPLPLGLVKKNVRSLLFIDNLIDFIDTVIVNDKALNQCFHVSDKEAYSTTSLLIELRKSLGSSFLLPVPAILIKIGCALLGRGQVANRLLGTLKVDSSKAKELLGWTPPVSAEVGLMKTAIFFREKHKVRYDFD